MSSLCVWLSRWLNFAVLSGLSTCGHWFGCYFPTGLSVRTPVLYWVLAWLNLYSWEIQYKIANIKNRVFLPTVIKNLFCSSIFFKNSFLSTVGLICSLYCWCLLPHTHDTGMSSSDTSIPVALYNERVTSNYKPNQAAFDCPGTQELNLYLMVMNETFWSFLYNKRAVFVIWNTENFRDL